MKKYNGYSNIIGDLIKQNRKERNMSANDVCKKLATINVFMNPTDIYRIEYGKKMVKDFEMVALCKVLEIDFKEVKFYF